MTPNPRNAVLAMISSLLEIASAMSALLQMSIARHAQIGLRLVPREAFDRTQARTVLSDQG
jgi:hypothetical protein